MEVPVNTSTNSRGLSLDAPLAKEKEREKARVEARQHRGLHEDAECSAGIGQMALANLETNVRLGTTMIPRLRAREDHQEPNQKQDRN